MKKMLFLNIILIAFNSYSQWIESDSLNKEIEINYYDESLFYYTDIQGISYYCGLFFDNEDHKYLYYKKKDRSDIVLMKCLSLKDSSHIIGFYRLQFPFLPSSSEPCWLPDIFRYTFDKQNRLIKQEYFNDGELITPKEFKLQKK